MLAVASFTSPYLQGLKRSVGEEISIRFIESPRLEKNSKVIQSNCPPITSISHYTMSLSTTSEHFLNTSRDSDSITSLGSLYHCLTTLAEKKFFLTSNFSHPWHNLRPFPLVLLLLCGRRDQPPLHHNLLSGSYRELQGLPWATCSPHKTCASDSSQLHCPSLDTLHILTSALISAEEQWNIAS